MHRSPYVHFPDALSELGPPSGRLCRLGLLPPSAGGMARPSELCRQRFQEPAITADWLMDMQAPLNFPDARRNRLDDRNTKILL